MKYNSIALGQLMLIKQQAQFRKNTISSIAQELKKAHLKERSFDIIAMLEAIPKMLDAASAVESELDGYIKQGITAVFDAERCDDGETQLSSYGIALAANVFLTHAAAITESLISRCFEYAYKAQINSLSDYEADWHPCDSCTAAGEICGIPEADTVLAYMRQIKRAAHDAAGRIQSFAGNASDYYKPEPHADKALAEARVRAASVAAKMIGAVLDRMTSAIADATELAKQWRTTPGSKILEEYATMLAQGALCDGISIWISDMSAALPFA